MRRSSRILLAIALAILIGGLGVSWVQAQSSVTLHWQHTVWVPEALEIFENAVREFEKENPSVRVQLTQVPTGDNEAKIKLAAATGTAPDLVMLSATGVGELGREGLLADIGELAPAGFLDRFYDAALEIVSIDGKVMALPQEGSARAAFYRKDLFAEAGLDPEAPPTTWEELVEYGKALTRVRSNGQKQWGLGFSAGSWEAMENWLPFMWQAGNDIVRVEDGEWVSVMNEETGLVGMQFYADLIHKHGIVPPQIAGWDWEETKNQFVHGNIAMMMNGMWVLPILQNDHPELAGKFGTFLYPAGPTGQVGVSRGMPLAIGITAGSRHKDVAWELLEHIYTPGEDGTSVMDRMAIAAGAVNWRHGFEDLPYAQEDLIRPFIEAVPLSRTEPLSPAGDTFKMQYANAIIQQVVLGERTPSQALEELHNTFNRLHR